MPLYVHHAVAADYMSAHEQHWRIFLSGDFLTDRAHECAVSLQRDWHRHLNWQFLSSSPPGAMMCHDALRTCEHAHGAIGSQIYSLT